MRKLGLLQHFTFHLTIELNWKTFAFTFSQQLKRSF